MDELKLLQVLKNDPRISITDLADILNESEESVIRTKHRLEDEKIICGYHTVINWDKTNSDYCSAMIEVACRPERTVGYDKVASEIAKFDEVSDLFLMSGANEFMVILHGKTMRDVADFIGQKLAVIDGVKNTTTYFILKRYKSEGVRLEKEEIKNERLLVTI